VLLEICAGGLVRERLVCGAESAAEVMPTLSPTLYAGEINSAKYVAAAGSGFCGRCEQERGPRRALSFRALSGWNFSDSWR